MNTNNLNDGNATMSDLAERILAGMNRWKAEGALWTSDIADRIRATTPKTRSALQSLERRGLVLRVVSGNPSSWKLPE